jgi:hypothetical protein
MNKFKGIIDGVIRHKGYKNFVLLEYTKSDEHLILNISYRQRIGNIRSSEFLDTLFLDLKDFLLEHGIKQKSFLTSIKEYSQSDIYGRLSQDMAHPKESDKLSNLSNPVKGGRVSDQSQGTDVTFMDGRDTFCVICGHDNSVISVIDDERINCLCCRSDCKKIYGGEIMANLYLGGKEFELIYRCKKCNIQLSTHEDCVSHKC